MRVCVSLQLLTNKQQQQQQLFDRTARADITHSHAPNFVGRRRQQEEEDERTNENLLTKSGGRTVEVV